MQEQKYIETEFEDWEEMYKPIKNSIVEHANYDGLMYETYGKEVDIVWEQDPKNVWTLIDGEGRDLWIIQGRHHVNRLGYFITEKPWNDDVTVDVIA